MVDTIVSEQHDLKMSFRYSAFRIVKELTYERYFPYKLHKTRSHKLYLDKACEFQLC